MVFLKDMIGCRFGKLLVTSISTKPRYLLCTCDCGNQKEVRSNHLSIGKIITCSECPIFELPGKKIGKLTVLQYIPGSGGKGKPRKFQCICECGKETHTHSTSLLNGSITSCGKCIDKISKIGKKFGHLRVISWAGTSHTNSKWHCICDCGNYTISAVIPQSKAQSCGCSNFRGARCGERGKVNRLTEEQVKECRKIWTNELISRKAYSVSKHRYSIQDLADKYHVSQTCIHHMLHSKTWFFLPPIEKNLQDSIKTK